MKIKVLDDWLLVKLPETNTLAYFAIPLTTMKRKVLYYWPLVKLSETNTLAYFAITLMTVKRKKSFILLATGQIVRDKHASLFCHNINDNEKKKKVLYYWPLVKSCFIDK
jgi:hypothetical protein